MKKDYFLRISCSEKLIRQNCAKIDIFPNEQIICLEKSPIFIVIAQREDQG